MEDLIDLVFLLDESGSVGPTQFHQMLETTSDITSYFNIEAGNLRVGLATFSDETIIHFYLNTYEISHDITNAILSIPYMLGYATNIAGAIDTAVDVLFHEANGHRPDAIKLMILMTDGESQTPHLTIQSVIRARSVNINSIAIGIGDIINYNELVVITDFAETVILSPTFDHLQAVVTRTLLTICPGKIHINIL